MPPQYAARNSTPNVTYRTAFATMKRGNLWMNHVTQPIAAVMTVPLVRMRAKPNAITVTSWFVLLAGAILVAVRGQLPWTGAVFAVAAVISYSLDGADGAVARLTGTASQFGAWFDVVVDRICHTSVMLVLGLANLPHTGSRTEIVRAFAPWIVLMVVTTAYHGGFNLRGAMLPVGGEERERHRRSRAGIVTEALLLTVCDFGFLMFSIGVGEALGIAPVVVWVQSALHVAGFAALTWRVRQVSVSAS